MNVKFRSRLLQNCPLFIRCRRPVSQQQQDTSRYSQDVETDALIKRARNAVKRAKDVVGAVNDVKSLLWLDFDEDKRQDQPVSFQAMRSADEGGQQQLLQLERPPALPDIELKVMEKQELNIQSQLEYVLPPWQSIVELSIPPVQSDQDNAVSNATQMEITPALSTLTEVLKEQGVLQGSGYLQDGSKWSMQSGEEKGEHGYWCRWWEVEGSSPDGSAWWVEKWWESSDWLGLKELGAEKIGKNSQGQQWKERWTEKIAFDKEQDQWIVQRSAHKQSNSAENIGQEWEEKWQEHYQENGVSWKWADKWAKHKDNAKVWHERWGEDYDGQGGCVKWTDRWAEEQQEDVAGGIRKWGEKWEERFKDGKGTKYGENWEQRNEGENRYQRWWGEDHFGDRRVRKWGNSTSGEHWDVEEQMDTYYNPIPHYGYKEAMDHSPQLKAVPILPRTGDITHKSIKNF